MNKTAVTMVAIFAVLTVGGSGFASGISEKTVSLSDLLTEAYEANPEIKAARASWRAATEKYRVMTAYPDPQFMITWFPDPIETRLGPQDWNASISQMIPFPGKLSTAGDVAEIDARMARLALDAEVRDVSVSVSESYHELYHLRTAKRIAEKNAELLEQLRTIAETAHARDRALFYDVVKAQSQTGQIRYDILVLEEKAQTEQTRLNSLLNRPPESPIGKMEPAAALPVVYTLDEIYRMAEENTESIQMADLRVDSSQARQRLAGFENMPDFRVGLFYAGIGDPDVAAPPPDAGQDAVGIQFGVSIPLWFGKNAGRKAQARAETEKAEAMKAAAVNMVRTKVHALRFRLKNAERLMTLYREDMLPQAMRAVETAETWFREGEGSFADFTEAQAAAYNFQLSLARAQADYGKALANLERLVGQRLTVRSRSAGSEEIQ